MKDNKIKVGDLVWVKQVGIDGAYTVDKIEGDLYYISQGYDDISSRGHKTKSSYKHTMKLPLDKLRKM